MFPPSYAHPAGGDVTPLCLSRDERFKPIRGTQSSPFAPFPDNLEMFHLKSSERFHEGSIYSI